MNTEDLLAELRALADVWDRCAAINESASDDHIRNGDTHWETVRVLRAHAFSERSDARELREILDPYAGGSGVAEGGIGVEVSERG
jgi:hypothetical protein